MENLNEQIYNFCMLIRNNMHEIVGSRVLAGLACPRDAHYPYLVSHLEDEQKKLYKEYCNGELTDFRRIRLLSRRQRFTSAIDQVGIYLGYFISIGLESEEMQDIIMRLHSLIEYVDYLPDMKDIADIDPTIYIRRVLHAFREGDPSNPISRVLRDDIYPRDTWPGAIQPIYDYNIDSPIDHDYDLVIEGESPRAVGRGLAFLAYLSHPEGIP